MAQRHKGKKQRARFSEDHLDALMIYATDLMAAIGLPIYQIKIMEKRASKGSIAEILTTDDRYVACLYLGRDWLDRTEDERRETITHEILHLWHRELSDWFATEVHDLVNVHDYIKLDRQYQHLVELMVDRIAMILSDTHRLKEVWREAHGGAPPIQILEVSPVDD